MASTEAKSCVVTESTIYRLKYKWTPTDLSNLKVERGQPGSKILIGSSECFEFNGSTFPLDVLQFNVKLYREVSKANIDFVSVSVFTIPNEGTGGTGTGGTVQCKIGMLDKENKVLDLPNLRSYEFMHFHNEIVSVNFKVAKVNDFLDPNKGLLSNGEVTFFCEIELLPHGSSNLENSESLLDMFSAFSLEENISSYKDALDTGYLAEAILRVKEIDSKVTNIPVHKMVLSHRSSIFHQLLTKKSKKREKIEKVWYEVYLIKDLSVKVLRSVLHYLYTGRLTSLTTLEEMCDAAEKYKIRSLTLICDKYYSTIVNSYASKKEENDRRVEIWAITAEKYSLSRLSDACNKYYQSDNQKSK